MRRAGFVLIGLAVLLVVVAIIARAGRDDEPAPPTTPATVAAGPQGPTPAPGPASPAACAAFDPLEILWAATIADVESALEADNEAALAVAITRTVDRRSRLLETALELRTALPAEYRRDLQAVADPAVAFLDGLAEVDLSLPQEEATSQILFEVARFQADADGQTSLQRINRYLSSCPRR